MSPSDHRLAALWFADIVDYSRLAATDEDRAVALVERFQAVVGEVAAAHGGRVVKYLGDGALVEFGSTRAAVEAAGACLTAFAERLASEEIEPKALRIGIHVGDVVTMPDGDLVGDGVNLAARLQEVAGPGEIVVSEDVWRQMRQRPGYRFEALGERELKGSPLPMAVHRLATGAGAGSAASAPAAASSPAAGLAARLRDLWCATTFRWVAGLATAIVLGLLALAILDRWPRDERAADRSAETATDVSAEPVADRPAATAPTGRPAATGPPEIEIPVPLGPGFADSIQAMVEEVMKLVPRGDSLAALGARADSATPPPPAPPERRDTPVRAP